MMHWRVGPKSVLYMTDRLRRYMRTCLQDRIGSYKLCLQEWPTHKNLIRLGAKGNNQTNRHK
jgi:hypothetical protein